jgi:hypothetical protein
VFSRFLELFWSLKRPLLGLLKVNDLGTLSLDAVYKLDVLGHDGDMLGMDGTQVGVYKETSQVSLLESHDGR